MLGYIRKQEMLCAGDRVGVAVSGGADSVALLRLMLEVQDELGVILSVVHLNHKLRGASADADEQFVRDLAATHNLEITSESRDVRAYATEKQLSIEAAARELRYEFFRCLLQSRVNRIATAHTMDDQAETVLLKLARGAGTRGLAGIYPKLAVSRQPSAIRKTDPHPPVGDEPSIMRPLLGTRRSELRYLLEIDQNWREDASNQDLRYTRNRVRHQIVPFFEKEINSSLCEVLAGAAEIARGEEEFWVREMQRMLPEIWSRSDQGDAMNSARLRTFPFAVQRRLVRAAAESVGIALEFRHVEEVLALRNEGDRVVLPNCCEAAFRGGQIKFHQLSGQTAAADYSYELPAPGRLFVAEAGIEIEVLLCSGEDETAEYGAEHLVPSAFIQGGLVVRNWRAGERFWPAHSKEPKKIKELLQDRHITGERKRLWPVVACGEEIIWIPGFGVRRNFQTNDGTGILIRETGKSTSRQEG